MTDAERTRCLRRLRFPRELEAAFQQDYFQRVLPSFRVGLGLMALVTVGQAVGFYLQAGPNAPLLAVALGRPIPLLATFGLTFWPRFWRYWQQYFVALLAVGLPLALSFVGPSLSSGGFGDEPAARLGYLAMLTLYGMVMLSGLLRLQFAWTVAYQGMLVGYSLAAALTHVPLPPQRVVAAYGFIILPALLMVTLAAYSYERLQRSAFLSNHLLEIERARSEAILRNTLPDPIVDRLKASAGVIADDHVEVTVLFADIAEFTPWSADKPAREVLELLNRVFSRFDRLVETHGLEKIKTVGDCYMVVAGAPEPRADHVEAAARLALAMQAEAQELSDGHGVPLRFRIGIHTGPLIAGVIGEKRLLYDVWGDTVNTASRLESSGVPGTIQVSARVAEKIEAGFVLRSRGEVEIKGKGLIRTYFLEGVRSA